MQCVELPLICHTKGPDQDRIRELVKEEKHCYIVLTSPEAADVFVAGWEESGCVPVGFLGNCAGFASWDTLGHVNV